ncbi:MAG: alpha/beta fold hydrolase [Bacteroidia bacterium]
MKKILLRVLKALLIIYIFVCGLLYFIQEKLIFFPKKLNKDFQFEFYQNFEELNIRTRDNVLLNGLLFKSDSSKGLIFYLHGNAGSLKSWGDVASTYTTLNYDVFILDYRGYGKSEGSISSEEQLYQDIQTVYDNLKTRYDENKIIVLGYSIGTGPATKLAASNNPELLILQAPYYSLIDMMRHTYPVIPTFILKYKFETNKFIKECKMPVVIFHGNSDEVIYYNSSVKLRGLFKKTDTLITLNGQGHNGITYNPEYIAEMEKILK